MGEIMVYQRTVVCIFFSIVIQFADKSLTQGFRRGVTREIWQSVPGQYVSNLTSSSQYQHGNPKIKDIMNHFNGHVDIANNYGQRLTVYYRAPETGPYVFYMTCADECELWWSPDENHYNKRRIIFVPFGLNLPFNDWENSAAQVSSPITLCTGEFYFMQAIMKAGSSSYDHLSIGVRQPNGELHRPILNGDLFCEIPEKRSNSFLLVQKDSALVGHVTYSRTVSNMECALYCARDNTCQSYNYNKVQGICELNNDTRVNNVEKLVPSEAVEYYEKLQP